MHRTLATAKMSILASRAKVLRDKFGLVSFSGKTIAYATQSPQSVASSTFASRWGNFECPFFGLFHHLAEISAGL